jgi:hypothetical protein
MNKNTEVKMNRRAFCKTHLVWLASLVIFSSPFRGTFLGTAIPAYAQSQDNRDHSCSVASLKGAYGFFRSGTTPVGPLAAVGILDFDGAGSSTVRQTTRKNGISTSDLFNTPAMTGPYEIDPDCAGRILNPDGSALAHFVVVNGGNEVFILSLSAGNSVNGVMKRISTHRQEREGRQ